MTVGQLLRTISSAELTEWMAFYTLEWKEAEAERKKREKD